MNSSVVNFAIILEAFGEFEKFQLAVILVDDAAAAEGHDNLHFVAVLEETDGVVALELHVMFADLRTQADLLDFRLGTVRLDFLQFFLLLVKILLVVHHLAHGWVGLRGNLHQIHSVFVSNRQCFSQ